MDYSASARNRLTYGSPGNWLTRTCSVDDRAREDASNVRAMRFVSKSAKAVDLMLFALAICRGPDWSLISRLPCVSS